MTELTFEKLTKAARLLGEPWPPLESGTYDWAKYILGCAGKSFPKSWPRSTPFFTINYTTLVYKYLEAISYARTM